jgi:arabinose-5-phosphate isomerase
MTSARAGSAAIVDDDNRVVGVFTDGDLRRHLTQTPDMATMPVSQFMTKHPITLTQDHLAVDVLKLFEEHNIDDLVIVDNDGRLAGIVDIQDLPKLKIM